MCEWHKSCGDTFWCDMCAQQIRSLFGLDKIIKLVNNTIKGTYPYGHVQWGVNLLNAWQCAFYAQ